MASDKGRENFYATKHAEAEAMPELAKGDRFIAEVNQQRRAQNDQQFMAAMGALQAGLSTIQQIQINQALARSGGVVTPQIRQMQDMKMMSDFQAQVLALSNPAFKEGMNSMSSALNPFVNSIMGQQLVDSSYGKQAPEIIQTFASSLAVQQRRHQGRRRHGL